MPRGLNHPGTTQSNRRFLWRNSTGILEPAERFSLVEVVPDAVFHVHTSIELTILTHAPEAKSREKSLYIKILTAAFGNGKMIV